MRRGRACTSRQSVFLSYGIFNTSMVVSCISVLQENHLDQWKLLLVVREILRLFFPTDASSLLLGRKLIGIMINI